MICFCWSQLPYYAANCIGAFVQQAKERVVVVATRPKVPIRGMEHVAGCDVKWVLSETEDRGIISLTGEMPQFLFVSGWAIPIFNRYRDEVRAAGGKVYAMSDGNSESWLVAVIRAIRFRLRYRSKYDGFFVPGKSGFRLFRMFGVESSRISTGLYSADPLIFHGEVPLSKRQKRMVYVGRFEPVKNVLALCEAFRMASGAAQGWRLELYGCGSLKDKIIARDGIYIYDFLQPLELSEVYRSARAFVLPSVCEPWGVVVHEAALSGCVLLLSDCVGAADDLTGVHNGIRFNPRRVADISHAMQKVFAMTDDELDLAYRESLQQASRISPKAFAEGANRLLTLKKVAVK